jgi:hypothetical protein
MILIKMVKIWQLFTEFLSEWPNIFFIVASKIQSCILYQLETN